MTLTIGMLIFSIICGLGLTAGITATVYSQSWIQQYDYSQIGDSDLRMDYILNEMSCQTIMLSTELHISEEPVPRMIDGECWDHCQVLMPGYEPEPDHYFVHVPFGDDGYMSFTGLDELVQECKRQ